MKYTAAFFVAALAALTTSPFNGQAFAEAIRAIEANAVVATAANRAPGSVSVTLMPGAGLSVDVTVDFESVTNLSLANVGISAGVISPLDVGLLARLPLGAVTIPAAFPVLVDITPPPGPTPLAFDGLAMVTLRTDNLPYYEGVRLRLFVAHGGGSFSDITDEVSQGSYRVRGSNGDFSEFLIVQDDRTGLRRSIPNRSNSEAVNVKLSALQARLSSYSLLIDLGVHATLTAQLAAVETHWINDEPEDALADLDAFTASIVAATPAQIPQSWEAGSSELNANGVLRALASTLRFSLADQPCPANGNYADFDMDGIPDECDNCTLVSNANQCDANEDGYGNHCDADLNDDGVVNFSDLAMLKSAWLSADPNADLTCNGVVNFLDLATMKSMWLAAPGPSNIDQ